MRKFLGPIALVLLALSCSRHGRPGDTLSLAMEQDVLTLDPHGHDDSVTHSVLSNVYDPLVTFDRSMRVVPALATHWDNPSDLVWRFHLRRGVAFHDGRPFHAADAKFSFERASRTKTGHYLPAISAIRVLDEETLEIETPTPEPVLLNKLAVVGIVPAGTPDGPHDAVGTGAYRVVTYAKGRSLELAANERFWGGRPAIPRAIFKVLPHPAERARALARREIQLARDVTAADLGAAPNIRHSRFLAEPGLNVVFLGVHFLSPGPLREAKVRQAVFWALDPREIIREAGVAGAPCDQPVPALVSGYLPRPDAGRPRLALAKSLLREAGYPDGFETTLEMPASVADRIGPVLTRQLARVGIGLRTVSLPWAELSSRLDRRASPFYYAGWACYGDASDLLDAVLHSRQGDAWGNSNFGDYSSPEMDAVVERAGRTLDSAARLGALHEAMSLSLEDLPLIPLFQRKRAFGVDERLLFDPRQNGQVVLFELAWS